MAKRNVRARTTRPRKAPSPRQRDLEFSPAQARNLLDLLNQAVSPSDLLRLVPIKPSVAETLVRERQKVGVFTSVEDVLLVQGLDPVTLDTLLRASRYRSTACSHGLSALPPPLALESPVFSIAAFPFLFAPPPPPTAFETVRDLKDYQLRGERGLVASRLARLVATLANLIANGAVPEDANRQQVEESIRRTQAELDRIDAQRRAIFGSDRRVAFQVIARNLRRMIDLLRAERDRLVEAAGAAAGPAADAGRRLAQAREDAAQELEDLLREAENSP